MADHRRICGRCGKSTPSRLVHEGAPLCFQCHATLDGGARVPVLVPRCPQDGSELVLRESADLIVDRCPMCGGVWLKPAQLEALTRQGNAARTAWFAALVGAMLGGD